MFEETEVDAEGRLLVRCEDVPEDAADLARPECLRAVLRALRDETGVRCVVLVHDREKAHGSRAMSALNALLAAGRLLDQFAARAPVPAFSGFTAKEAEAACATCVLRPATAFPRLRDVLLGDPGGFLTALREVAEGIDGQDEEGCGACTAATVQDLRILLRELERVAGG